MQNYMVNINDFCIKMTDHFGDHSGFSCADTQFTCKNGECVKRNLQCDGYKACKDGSDEDNCDCPSKCFSVRGEDAFLQQLCATV